MHGRLMSSLSASSKPSTVAPLWPKTSLPLVRRRPASVKQYEARDIMEWYRNSQHANLNAAHAIHTPAHTSHAARSSNEANATHTVVFINLRRDTF